MSDHSSPFRGRRFLACGAPLAAILLLAGCTAVGPRRVRVERYDYNEAVVQSQNEQMLLNLVRLRYRDTPYFLQVSSVSTHYEKQGSIGLNGSVGQGNNSSFGAGTGLSVAERPTVTYAPLIGEEFVKRMLSPIPIESLLLISQSGWRADRVLRCAVQQLNDLDNAPRASGPTPTNAPEYEAFYEATRLLWDLQKKGATLSIQREVDGNHLVYVRFRRELMTPEEQRRITELLDLTEGVDEYRLVSSTVDRGPTDLAFVTRSLMGTLYYLSQAVEPPQRDRDAGRVTTTLRLDGSEFDWSEMLGELLRIHSSLEPPEDFFVRVRYRDAWFYINDADLSSKTTFGLLAQLFSLQAGDTRGGGPLLTLPVGG